MREFRSSDVLLVVAFTVLFVAAAALLGAVSGPETQEPQQPPQQAFGNYPVNHPPVFQRGDRLSQPLDDADPKVAAFLRFYSAYVRERSGADLPSHLTAADILAFPSTRYSYVGVTPREYGTDLPQAELQYATSSYCADCHDATLTLAGVDPPMRIPALDSDLYANWSPYGEWSVSLMGLSGRDPVFHAQVETERLRHAGADPTDIDNVCYSCHGGMGERQIHQDLGTNFNHFMIYATPDNFDAAMEGSPDPSDSPKFAKYGALARDSVSCQLCHHIGPRDGNWEVDGEVDWTIFYGPRTEEYPRREGNEPGPPYPFTATFQDNLNRLYVPSEGVAETEEPMLLLGMARAEQTPHIKRSEYCGGCHVVIVPKIPEGYADGVPVPGMPGVTYTGNPFTDPNVGLAYEQTTYFEYVTSGYPGLDIHCQTCHMPGLAPPGEKVVSVSPAWYRPDYPDVPRRDYKRHRLLGINLFVHEMFQQFYDILGLADPTEDGVAPADTAANLLSAEQSIVQHATGGPFGEPTAAITIVAAAVSDGALEATVKVTNNSGHKFPSGAGFRRGFIELQVLDAGGEVLWVSGKTNEFGVILGADGEPLDSEFTTVPGRIQPHYTTITSPDQAQIYEVRTEKPTAQGAVLTTQTLSLFNDVKDNRVLPAGWMPPDRTDPDEERFGLNVRQLAHITGADFVGNDPDYSDPGRIGTDTVVYRVDTGSLDGEPASVRATMRYQTIPPYFLVDRFVDGLQQGGFGTATTRLIYLTSRLNTDLGLSSATMSVDDFEVMSDWTMTLSRHHVAVQR